VKSTRSHGGRMGAGGGRASPRAPRRRARRPREGARDRPRRPREGSRSPGEALRRAAGHVVSGQRAETGLGGGETSVGVARIEAVEEPLASEEVGLGSLLGERVDVPPPVLLELVFRERRFGQDLGKEIEPLVEVLLEDVEARDRRVGARRHLQDRGEVVERGRQLARRPLPRAAEERLGRDLRRPLAPRRVARAPRPGKDDGHRDGGALSPAGRADGNPRRKPPSANGGGEKGRRGPGGGGTSVIAEAPGGPRRRNAARKRRSARKRRGRRRGRGRGAAPRPCARATDRRRRGRIP